MFAHAGRCGRLLAIGAVLALTAAAVMAEPEHSVARRWNEVTLHAIRNDFARPPVHARNLYHVTVAMWDAWAAYDDTARQVLTDERATADDIAAARHEAISYAAYRVLYNRYRDSPGAYESLTSFDNLMKELGYDPDYSGREGESPAALGNRIGNHIVDLGYDDGADELGSYAFEWEYRPRQPADGGGELRIRCRARPQPLAAAGPAHVHRPGRPPAGGRRAALHRLALGGGHPVRAGRRWHGRRGRLPRPGPAALLGRPPQPGVPDGLSPRLRTTAPRSPRTTAC